VSFVPFDNTVTVNYLSGGADSLSDGEYARLSLVSAGVWDMHVYSIVVPTTAPDNQVLLGLGGISTKSSGHFTYDVTRGEFNVNYSSSEAPYIAVDHPLPVTIRGADSSGVFSFDLAGAPVNITSGAGFGAGAGGDITIAVGNGGAPGHIHLNAGPSNTLDPGSQIGGCVFIRGGDTWGPELHAAGGLVVLQMGRQDTTAFNAGKSGILLKSGGEGEDQGAAIIVNGKCAIGIKSSFDASSPDSAEAAVEAANYGVTGYVLRSNGQTSSVNWVAPEFKPAPLTVITTTSTLLVMGAAGDHNNLIRCNSIATVTVQIKADSYWTNTNLYWEQYAYQSPMPTGGSILFSKTGIADVVLVPDAGVTINTPSSLIITKSHGKITLIKVGPNEWDVEGNLA
jgi:hypothetical protein